MVFFEYYVFVDDNTVERFTLKMLNLTGGYVFSEERKKGLQHVGGKCLELKIGIFYFSRYLLCYYIVYQPGSSRTDDMLKTPQFFVYSALSRKVIVLTYEVHFNTNVFLE